MNKKDTLQNKLKECANNLFDSITFAKSLHDNAIVQTEDGLDTLYGTASSSWNNMTWSRFTISTACSPPPPVRIGGYNYNEGSRVLQAPAVMNILCGRNLLIKTNSAGKSDAIRSLQSITLRLFATMQPDKFHTLFIDPVNLGENSGIFMALGDYKEDLVGRKALWEEHDIEQELATINEHIAMVIQKYLRDRFKTIDEYNAEAGELAEPYTAVVVFNFPTGFSEQSLDLLLKIAKNGPRCGVSVLLVVDTEQKLPDNFDLTKLEETSTVIKQVNGQFVLANDPFPDGTFYLDSLPPKEIICNIIQSVGTASKKVEFKAPFEQLIPKQEDWWKGSTAQGIRIPIGLMGTKESIYFELGYKTAHHCLLAGVTGSGKSTLLHVLITNLALTYSPEELQLYLVDFKKGVEFRNYADKKLPHAKVIAIETEREFGLSMLRRLDEELTIRGKLLIKENCEDIHEFRKIKKLPRILLLVEEFQEFFSEDDKLADDAVKIIERLVRQGRSFGIHIILSSQTLAGEGSRLRGAIMQQMGLRIALKCSEEDSREILGQDNPAAKSLSRPGEAIYNSEGGNVNYNKFFQVAWLSDTDREKYLERIQELEKTFNHEFEPPIIFKGFEETKPEESRFLQKVLELSNWPSDNDIVSAWLGEPLAIREEPTSSVFYPRSGRNLLVAGKDEKTAVGILATALASLSLQYHPKDAQFYIIDLSIPDKSHVNIFQEVANSLPHKIQIIQRQQDIEQVIGNMKQILETEQHELPVYLFIMGLQRIKSFRQGNSSSFLKEDEASQSPAQQLANILRDGPEKNIHVLLWCDTVSNFEHAFQESLDEFGMRVALSMVENDSVKLLDNSSASKLLPYRAFFWDETQPSELEKFRPYIVTESFSNFVNQLQSTMKKREHLGEQGNN